MKANENNISSENVTNKGGVFNWDFFTEEQYKGLLEEYKERKDDELHFDSVAQCEYEGEVRIGELCFDISTRRDKNGYELLSFDLFVGGVDTGFGYTDGNNNDGDSYPYDHVGIGYVVIDWMNLSYNEFVEMAEEAFDKYIDYYNEDYAQADLREKAKAQLKIW